MARTKEAAQQELKELFGAKDTAGFRQLLIEGKVEVARKWLQHIVDHKEDFPQYQVDWDCWLRDRQMEIKEVESGAFEKLTPTRSKEESQQDLLEKFGVKDTAGFRKLLELGKIELAEQWLQYIIDNKAAFPQYHATWGSWLVDRQRELAAAKN